MAVLYSRLRLSVQFSSLLALLLLSLRLSTVFSQERRRRSTVDFGSCRGVAAGAFLESDFECTDRYTTIHRSPDRPRKAPRHRSEAGARSARAGWSPSLEVQWRRSGVVFLRGRETRHRYTRDGAGRGCRRRKGPPCRVWRRPLRLGSPGSRFWPCARGVSWAGSRKPWSRCGTLKWRTIPSAAGTRSRAHARGGRRWWARLAARARWEPPRWSPLPSTPGSWPRGPGGSATTFSSLRSRPGDGPPRVGPSLPAHTRARLCPRSPS